MPFSAFRLTVLAALTALVALALPAAAQAQAPHEKLTPLLVELPQWTAEPVEGMSMQTQGQDMVWASRTYKRGDSELNVIVGVGHPMAGQAEAMREMGKTQYQTNDASFETGTVRGYQVARFYNKAEKSGMIFIVLSPNSAKGATLILQYTAVDPRDAMAIAERFDWAAMQRTALR